MVMHVAVPATSTDSRRLIHRSRRRRNLLDVGVCLWNCYRFHRRVVAVLVRLFRCNWTTVVGSRLVFLVQGDYQRRL